MGKRMKNLMPDSIQPVETSTWIHYQDSIIIFLDILGFQDLINESYSNKPKRGINKKIADIYDGIMTIRTILKIDEQEVIGTKYFVSNFSDCVVIAFPFDKPNVLLDTLIRIQELLLNLSHKEIIVRGGITRGLIYSNRDFQIVFGPGLVEAYQLESKAAHYPRVILDNEIVKICKMHTNAIYENEVEKYLKNLLEQDTDGMFYIDYFKPLIEGLEAQNYDYANGLNNLRTIIVKGLKKMSPGIRIKYLWMKKKYNDTLKTIKKEEFLSKLNSIGRIQLAKDIIKLKLIS
ncbi:MAG TPA: hypothetical protein VHP32_06630 [Ignavibacteria bacterium]|nr:hypothetical protein [Ignavibacteria bacterium]